MLSALPLIPAEAIPLEADAARFVDDAILSARQALRRHPDAEALGETLDLMREALCRGKRLHVSGGRKRAWLEATGTNIHAAYDALRLQVATDLLAHLQEDCKLACELAVARRLGWQHAGTMRRRLKQSQTTWELIRGGAS